MAKDKPLSEKLVDVWVGEFGAIECKFNQNSCYKIGTLFIRLNAYPAIDTGTVYCIEAASEAEAEKGIFEDAWKYWDGDGEETMLQQMRNDLRTELKE